MPANERSPAFHPNGSPKGRGGGNKGLTQAYELRDLAANEAKGLAGQEVSTLEERCTRAQAIRAMVAVWSDASDRIRILRGRPLPGSKRPAPEKPKAHKATAFTPPTEEP